MNTINLLISFIALFAISTVTAFSPTTTSNRITTSELNAIKRGGKVRIKRTESYWYNEIGSVAAADKPGAARYPITVRFEKVNYAGVNTNNFCHDEVEEIIVEGADDDKKKK